MRLEGALVQSFSNCESRPQMGLRKKLWDCETNWILCFVPPNFENLSSAPKLVEKSMVIAHVFDKSENLGSKIDKSELDSE